MIKLKHANIASLMMLLWLCVYVCIAVFLPKWLMFASIIACTLPMLLFKQKHRGKTFGASNCNTVIYKRKEYIPFFIFTISGSALISALTYLVYKSLGGAAAVESGKGFFYMLVFSCFIPAFFEEWLLRGGVLGALAKYGGAGVLACAVMFALMHGLPRLPYTLFAGLLITALVYVTECIYLGMLLHFLNNFASVLLSYLSGGAEYIALTVIMIIFAISFVLIRRSKLFADVKNALCVQKDNIKEVVTPLSVVFAVCAVVIL